MTPEETLNTFVGGLSIRPPKQFNDLVLQAMEEYASLSTEALRKENESLHSQLKESLALYQNQTETILKLRKALEEIAEMNGRVHPHNWGWYYTITQSIATTALNP